MGLKYLYVPSGVKAGTAYGVMPNSADADFDDFTRNSAGSRVDKNGFINTGLGLGSEEITNGGFDSSASWFTSIATISNGRATFIDGTGAYSNVRQSNILAINKTYEVTIDVTINSGGGFKIQDGDSNTYKQITESGIHTFRFTAIGTSSVFYIARNQSGVAYNMYAESVSVREVTDVNTNVPRLDYTDGGCPSLLLEPQSTNITKYSEDFTQSYWVKEGNPTIESDVEISPTGNLNASYLKAPVGTNISPRVTQFFGCSASQTYTGSVFVKKDNIDYIRLLSTGATASTLQAYYNVSNGTLGASGSPDKAKIEDYGNGWYRLSLVINTTQNTGSATFRVQLSKGDGVPTSTYDGTEKNIIFGAQLEQQAYATSYIPNYGTAAGVTRAADVAGGTGDLSDTFNDSEGVLMAEISALDSSDTTPKYISVGDLSNGTSALYFIIRDNSIRTIVDVLGSRNLDITKSSIDLTIPQKIAVLYKTNRFEFWYNGFLVGSTLIGDVYSSNTLDTATFSAVTGVVPFYGKAKKLQYFDSALTDIDLEELTSWDSFIAMAEGQNYEIE